MGGFQNTPRSSYQETYSSMRRNAATLNRSIDQLDTILKDREEIEQSIVKEE